MAAAWGSRSSWASRSVTVFLIRWLAVSVDERLWCSKVVSFWNRLVLAPQIICLETSQKQKVIRMKQISQESGWVGTLVSAPGSVLICALGKSVCRAWVNGPHPSIPAPGDIAALGRGWDRW